MSQTSVIAAATIIAFFVFITVRGELPQYISVLDGTGAAQCGGSSSSGASSSGPTVSTTNPTTGSKPTVNVPVTVKG